MGPYVISPNWPSATQLQTPLPPNPEPPLPQPGVAQYPIPRGTHFAPAAQSFIGFRRYTAALAQQSTALHSTAQQNNPVLGGNHTRAQ